MCFASTPVREKHLRLFISKKTGSAVQNFNHKVLAKTIPNDVKEKVEGVLSQPGDEAYRQAHDQLMIANDA